MKVSRSVETEWLKEKRSANRKLLWLAPLIFVLLSFGLVLLMGPSPDGKHSYIVAATFNWYSLLILPVILTLLVTNLLKKEKTVNQIFYRTTGAGLKRQIIGKNIVAVIEIILILLISTIFIFFIGKSLLKENLSAIQLTTAAIYLIVGSLPVMSLSFILYRFLNQTLVLLINFILGNVAAVVAVESWWWLFPWAYSIRMMAPALGVHPNGTFLPAGDPLLNQDALLIGVGMAFIVYLLLLSVQLFMARRVENNG